MNQDSTQTDAYGMRDFFLLTVVISLFFGFMLGNRPLSVPDEGRYVEISREMAATGDYLTPRLNGVKYLEKPALFYWLESLSIRLFGLNEFTLRLWPALFALYGCLVVYSAGSRLFGRRTGQLAAVVLATSLLYYALSRVIILDMPVSVLLTAALLSFLVGTHETPGLKRRLFMWGLYAFAALAVLTKGLIGIVVPVMVIGAWIVMLGEWRVLRTMYLPSGLVLFLLITAPWHLLAGRANPEFFNFYFIHEHVQRYLTKIHHHYKPAWFYIPLVIFGVFPWTAFLVQSVKYSLPGSWRERHEHRDALFLLLWAVMVFLFFSASSSKLIPYILPVVPPLAILLGRYLAASWDRHDFPGIGIGYDIALAISLVLGGALLAFALPHAPRLGLYAYLPPLVIAAGAVGAWLLKQRGRFRGAFLSLTAGAAAFLIVLNAAAPLFDEHSVKDLALHLKPRLRPGDEVITYRTYYQDLPVYLERRITVVEWKGELAFGTTVEDASGWIIDGPAFWKRWQGTATVYMLTKKSLFQELSRDPRWRSHPVGETNETVLVVNKEMTP
jgi:4-amino-4-deoxy-L-arabinose transferase-like glycosyltransferase